MTEMLLEWVFTSVFLILAVLALRAAFGRRVSARLRYALWAVVLARLLVPVQLFTSPLAGTRFFSESRAEQTVTEWPITSEAHVTARPDDILSLSLPDEPLVNFPAVPQAPKPPTVPIAPEAPAAPDWTRVPAYLGWAWLGGSIVLALVLAASNSRFALRLRRSRIPMKWADCPLPVYAAVGLPSPCLFGLIRPAVYVTPKAAADPAMLRHVIAHEYTHFRQGDHLWSLLRCAALAAHWWNPLVWLSVKLSRRDGELACDEGALKRLGDGERLAYGNTLLALVTAKPGPGDLLRFATTMAGEKRSLKERVSRIACAPKRWLWAAVAVVLATALACACAFGSAEEPDSEDMSDLAADLTLALDLALNNEGFFVRIEGSVDGIDLDAGWVAPSWFESYFDDFGYPLGRLRFEIPLCGKSCQLEAVWTDESRTAVRVTATPIVKTGRYLPVGNLLFTVDLTEGTLLELEGYVPKLSPNDPELVPTEAEAVRTARIAAKLLTEAENYYRNHGGLSLSDYNPAGELVKDGWALRNTEALNAMTDLNRNGVPETVLVGDVYGAGRETGEPSGRGVGVLEGGELLWLGLASNIHAGQTSFLLYSVDEDYYLMEFEIHGGMGRAHGDYRIFTLENGTETTAWENHVEFDYCTDSIASVKDNFDPVAVAAFVDEADSLLEHCFLLVDTGANYRGDPPAHVQIDLRWLEGYAPGFHWDDGQTTLENVTRFKLMREHPTFTRDLNRNMRSERVMITEIDGGAGLRVELWDDTSDNVLWSDEGYYAHAGANAVFICTVNDRDYLLRYHPYMGQGWCEYSYELFTLTRDGKEQVIQQNSIEFDINFGVMHESFDPEAIAAFMDEINGLLSSSVQLINTDDDLWRTFQREGRLYDSLWWLPGFVRGDEAASLLDYLRSFQEYMEVANTSYPSILLGKSSFILSGDGSSVGIGDVPALISEADPDVEITSFTVLDMDGDGTDEVLVRLVGYSTDTSGYLLLREENGTIYGTIFNANNNWSNRWFNDLKTDGTFECGDVVGRWVSVSKLFYTAGGGTGIYGLTVFRYDPDYDLERFMVVQKEVTREEDLWAAMEAQKEKPDAVWYEFHDKNIADVFMKG